MKIAIIAPIRFLSPNCVTGDATQMRETVKAIRKLPNVSVTCLYYESPEMLVSEVGSYYQWSQLAEKFDVAHVFTIFPKGYKKVYKALSKLPTLLSTVYWNNYFREYISVKNGTTIRYLLRSFEYIVRRLTRIKKRSVYEWCSGILPNSWAEGNVFKKVFKLKKDTLCVAIPNAISYPDNLETLKRPDIVPNCDYIVCPGIFAPRKNQISLIKAIKKLNLPVVFLGKKYEAVPKHYEKCRKEANPQMYFLGHISNTDELYWSILKYARVAVLTSDCETPGIALLESAVCGARPAITIYGGTQEYYGITAEYLNPYSNISIRNAVVAAWEKGRLLPNESEHYKRYTWSWVAQLTVAAYEQAKRNYAQHK